MRTIAVPAAVLAAAALALPAAASASGGPVNPMPPQATTAGSPAHTAPAPPRPQTRAWPLGPSASHARPSHAWPLGPSAVQSGTAATAWPLGPQPGATRRLAAAGHAWPIGPRSGHTSHVAAPADRQGDEALAVALGALLLALVAFGGLLAVPHRRDPAVAV